MVLTQGQRVQFFTLYDREGDPPNQLNPSNSNRLNHVTRTALPKKPENRRPGCGSFALPNRKGLEIGRETPRGPINRLHVAQRSAQ